MAAQDKNGFRARADLRADLDDLQKGLLPTFLPLMLATSWAWFGYAIASGGRPGFPEVAVIVSLVATYLVYAFRERHHALGCWLLLACMIVVESLMVVAHGETVIMVCGVLVVITANALLGTRQALVATGLTWGAGLAASSVSVGALNLTWTVVGMLALYGLTLAATWLSARPLRTTVHWALSGWRYANQALEQTRQRRAELRRALRALEEASYRIERMNSELIIARREAEEARAAKARLAATVSHELRGPLNLVLGFSKLMALAPESYAEPLPPSYRADVHTIYRNCQHLISLVDDVLDLSQIEAQRLPIVRQRVDLEEDVINQVVDIVQPLADRKGLRLRQEIAGHLPAVLADPVRLRQALLNLLTNAVRVTEQGEVAVRARQDGDQLVVSVEDSGPGIAREEMHKLFKEFTPLRPSGADPDAGSGLGLSITKHLVELHGGAIWTESELGKGTVFRFSLPVPGTQPLAPLSVQEREVIHPAKAESCLIVHRDLGTVRLFARYVQGYHVLGVQDENEALALIRELHPRAIVTTPEAAECIREQLAETPFDVPVISCAMPQPHGELGKATLGYLVKPISAEVLATVMRQVERDGETTILLVDDEPDAVRLLERMLTALPRGYKIIKAYDGRQALEIMSNTIPDVVFLDLVMPEIGGEEVLACMRADDRLRTVPVVIVSARDRIEGKVTLATPISVRCRQPLEIARGARCVQALVDALTPSYLPRSRDSAPH